MVLRQYFLKPEYKFGEKHAVCVPLPLDNVTVTCVSRVLSVACVRTQHKHAFPGRLVSRIKIRTCNLCSKFEQIVYVY